MGSGAACFTGTGSPSEPNYVSVASGDTWGITNDDGWNCVPDGDTADLPTDVYNPRGTCTDDAAHNRLLEVLCGAEERLMNSGELESDFQVFVGSRRNGTHG